MTKAELLASIAAVGVVNRVSDPELIGTNHFGDREYRVHVRKVSDNCVNYEYVNFLVISEGEPEEVAYFYRNDTIQFENAHEG